VPFPDKVWPIVQRHMENSTNDLVMTGANGRVIDFTSDKYISYKVTMKEWGILDYEHPEAGPQEHLPYDGRHTFQSMWGDLKLDNAMMEYLVGHTPKSIGKRVYTHYDIEALRTEMNKL
jgi:integrase